MCTERNPDSPSADSPPEIPDDGKLVDNIVHFARALKRAGVPVGTGQLITAIRAVQAAGFTRREDFRQALLSCLVSKKEHGATFDQVFRLFWRDPKFLEHMMAMLRPTVRGVQDERKAEAAARRASEALMDSSPVNYVGDEGANEKDRIVLDSTGTSSPSERLMSVDFEQMSSKELAEARRLIARLQLPVPPLQSRRRYRHVGGKLPDWRSTMRRSVAMSGELDRLEWQSCNVRWPSLVALCDISGSMSTYSRTLLGFLHAVARRKGNGWSRVHAFTFGTRLTNITRALRIQDVDEALAAAGAESPDWEGGTRIGECLHGFNRDWSRRVMSDGAVVLLVSDGLDCGKEWQLHKEMERLHLSSRRLIWINPLLRWKDFAPRARGIREMLPHVDCFRSAHDINSLAGLADAVANPGDAGEKSRLMAMMR